MGIKSVAVYSDADSQAVSAVDLTFTWRILHAKQSLDYFDHM